MMRRLAVLIASLLAGGCATSIVDADRSCLGGDLSQKQAAFLEYLTGGRAEGEKAVRARYCLGLIYSLRETDYYDLEESQTALESVVEMAPESAMGQHAALLLESRRERERLSLEIDRLRAYKEHLLEQVAIIEDEKELAQDQVEERDAQMESLGSQVAELNRRIDDLDLELRERLDELERIKKIDLQTPP